MKISKVIFISSVILTMIACGQMEDQSSSLDEKKSKVKAVCDIKDLPKGWVVVGHESSLECPNFNPGFGRFNQYLVKKAGDSELVCYDSPIPEGYVKVKKEDTLKCGRPSYVGDQFKNADVIEKL